MFPYLANFRYMVPAAYRKELALGVAAEGETWVFRASGWVSQRCARLSEL